MVKSSDGTLECLLWNPPDWKLESPARPIIFLHGLGTGIFQYIKLILSLCRPPAGAAPRPVLIPLQPSLSMAFLHPRHLKPPSKEDFTSAFLDVLKQLGWEKEHGGVDILAHSFGTIVFGE
jgi:pimeloyl-ACP methyl ester carboxylesterase